MSFVAAFLLVLREAIELTVIVGLLLAFLRRTGATQFGGWVWGGVVAGIVVSTLLAASLTIMLSLRGATVFPTRIVRLIEGTLYLVTAAVLVVLSVWMPAWSAYAHRLRIGLEAALERDDRLCARLFLFGGAFLTVVREFAEAYVMLTAARRVARPTWQGALAAAALALTIGIAIGVTLLRGLSKLRVWTYVAVASALLAVLAAALVAHGARALLQARALGPRIRWWNHSLWDVSSCCDDDRNEFFAALHSVLGYHDSPSFVEVVAYVGYWAILGCFTVVRNWSKLHRARRLVANVTRVATCAIVAGTAAAVAHCCIKPTWNGIGTSVVLLVVALVCVVVVYDCLARRATRKARRFCVIAMSIVVLICGLGIGALHVAQMACEERVLHGDACALGRFYYMGSILSMEYLVRSPTFTSWNALAVLTISFCLSTISLLLYSAALLLFSANVAASGDYMYRDIAIAKGITEEEVRELDIASDEALIRFSQSDGYYPWLSNAPPSPVNVTGAAETSLLLSQQHHFQERQNLIPATQSDRIETRSFPDRLPSHSSSGRLAAPTLPGCFASRSFPDRPHPRLPPFD